MSSALRGKVLREDYGTAYGRGREWPAYPGNLHSNYAIGESTSVCCSICNTPRGGLRFEPSTGEFMHRNPEDCATSRFSQR